MTLSLKARLTVWYSLGLIVVLALLAANVLWQQGRIGLRRVDRELADLTATVANVLEDELHEMGGLAPASADALHTLSAPGHAIAILDEHGAAVNAHWNGLSLPNPLADGTTATRVWTSGEGAGAWRVHSEPRVLNNTGVVLVTAVPLAAVYRERREVSEAMWVGFPLALLLAAAGGLWLATVGLRPITRMAERAAAISATGLQDLGESDRTDELGQLSRAFNGLIQRLRGALQTQRQFMADASHELRTPVSVIRSASEVTLSKASRDEHEYREALTIAGDQARRVGRLVEDMLVLARADAGGYPLRPEALYLNELVADCTRALELVAQERQVTIRVSPTRDLPFFGDEELLRRMIVNVVQNAVQHSPPGADVAIDATEDEQQVSIRIRDRGKGIPAADRHRIFDRFVQLDPSRTGVGTGLGLPIARWVAEAHGGTLDVESSGASGTTFAIVLPVRQTSQSRRHEEHEDHQGE